MREVAEVVLPVAAVVAEVVLPVVVAEVEEEVPLLVLEVVWVPTQQELLSE